MEQSGQTEASEDPLIVTAGEPVSLNWLVEDELLIAFPDIPRHEDEQCDETKRGKYLDSGLEVEAKGADNPFAVLNALVNDESKH
jgi:uncharacterized metal-binding protein YceD (DUF177 family)